MTPENFREALCRFGDHPDRIAELRKVAVGLAIAGHWKAGGDMRCAADLAGAIEAEKASLVGAGAISKPKTYPPVLPDNLPEVFKNSATFVPLGQIARIEKGQTGIKQAVPGDYPLVVTAAKRSSCDHFDFEGAAALIPLVSATGHGNASINRLHYQEGKFALGTILAAVFSYAPEIISARFLFEYLSTFKEELLVSRMTGTANVTLTIGKIAEVPVPLISPEVQGQLDAFMALCDQLETVRAEREAGRDRLTAATLARLNAPDPENFPADARFALDNLTPLTTRPDQIKQLRQTILNLAVQGLLVPQEPSEESASEIVRRVHAIKTKLGIRGDSEEAVQAEAAEAAPFSLPKGWTWCGATFPAKMISDAGRKVQTRDVLNIGTYPVVDQGKLFIRGYCNDDTKVIKLENPVIVFGDHTRETKLIDFDFVVGADGVKILNPLEIVPEFYFFCLKWLPLDSRGYGRHFKLLRQSLIPLPPIAEQHRIVAKVNKLMALCDELEAGLNDSELRRSRLLESVMHNALEPA